MEPSKNAVPIAVLVAVVACVLALVLGVVGIDLVVESGQTDRIPGLIGVVVSILGPTIVSLLALLKARDATDASATVNRDLHNGVLKDRVKEAIRELETEREERDNGRPSV